MLRTIPPLSIVAMAGAFAVALFSSGAHAQTSDDSRAQADVLFREGQQLMTAGQVDAGCAKLEESQRLDAKLGRLLNVAYCHEQLGRTATAWGEYNQAAALALQMGQSEREVFARNQAGLLARKLSFVRLDLPAGADMSQVSVDGRELAREQWAVPFPIDPGQHRLTFAAAGRQTREQTVTVSAAGTLRVAVEPLELERNDSIAAPSAPSPPPATVAEETPPSPDTQSASTGTRTLGWVVGAAGSVALGAGVGFGLRALSLQNEADPSCPGRMCTPQGQALIEDAKTAATISTVGFAVGVVGIVAGALLIVRSPAAPAKPQITAYLAPDRAGLALWGAW